MKPRTAKDYILYYDRKNEKGTWGVFIFKMWADEYNVFCISEELEFFTNSRLEEPEKYPYELIEQNSFQYIDSLQCSKWADKFYNLHNQESTKLKRLRKYHNEVCGKYLEWFGHREIKEPKSPPFFYEDNKFEIVAKDGKTYTLTTNQAAVVKVMYQSYIQGEKYIRFSEIIDNSNLIIEATKMSAVFDNNEEAKEALISYDNRLQKYFLKD